MSAARGLQPNVSQNPSESESLESQDLPGIAFGLTTCMQERWHAKPVLKPVGKDLRLPVCQHHHLFESQLNGTALELVECWTHGVHVSMPLLSRTGHGFDELAPGSPAFGYHHESNMKYWIGIFRAAKSAFTCSWWRFVRVHTYSRVDGWIPRCSHVANSLRRDCQFTDIPSPSQLKHLLKGEWGAAERQPVAN